jgi:hypothetical protein
MNDTSLIISTLAAVLLPTAIVVSLLIADAPLLIITAAIFTPLVLVIIVSMITHGSDG